MRAEVTEHMGICHICGNPKVEIHHLLFGTNHRKLADEDGLVIPLCKSHHTGSKTQSVHLNPAIADWSKTLGQAIWEKNALAEMLKEINPNARIEVREAFRQRYGKSYL